MRLSITILSTLALLLVCGCAQHDVPSWDFGASYRQVLRNQTLRPVEPDMTPGTGLGLGAAANTLKAYDKSFAPKGASAESETTMYLFDMKSGGK